MNRLAAALAVAGLLVLAGPTLLNASHPPVKPTTSGNALPEAPDATTSGAAFPETTRALPPTSTVPTVTSTTTTIVATTTVVPVDTQEVRFPITQVLPFETPRWRIDYRIDAGHLSLVITLTPLTNRADQIDERRAQLVEAKAEALAWLMERGGIKPSTYPIRWLPAEAATL